MKTKIIEELEVLESLYKENPKYEYLCRKISHDIYFAYENQQINKLESDLYQSTLNRIQSTTEYINYEYVFKCIDKYSTTGINIVSAVGLKRLFDVRYLSYKYIKSTKDGDLITLLTSPQLILKVCLDCIERCETLFREDGHNSKEFYIALNDLEMNMKVGIERTAVHYEIKEISKRYIALLERLVESNRDFYYNPVLPSHSLRKSTMFNDCAKEKNEYVDYLEYYIDKYKIDFIKIFYFDAPNLGVEYKNLLDRIHALDIPYNFKNTMHASLQNLKLSYTTVQKFEPHSVISAVKNDSISSLSYFSQLVLVEALDLAKYIMKCFTVESLIVYCIHYADICSKEDGNYLPKDIIFNTTLKLCLTNLEELDIISKEMKELVYNKYRREN